MNSPRDDSVLADAVQRDAARSRLYSRGTEHVEIPFDAQVEAERLAEEQRALRASRPSTRRFKALDKFEAELERLRQRQAEAAARLQEAEAALARAPEDDAKTLADWLANGERGERPEPSLYERERDRNAARLLLEAASVEIDRALERRFQHITKNQTKMVADARKDVEEARARLLAHVRAVPALRQSLIEARGTLLWAAAYPDAQESFGFTSATALGLREPVERTLGTERRVEHAALLAALEEDATALADAFSPEQARQLGLEQARTPLKVAMWDDDPDHVAWKRQELERLREIAQWSPTPHEVAVEAQELRP